MPAKPKVKIKYVKKGGEIHIIGADGTPLCRAKSMKLVDIGGDLLVVLTLCAVDVDVVEIDRSEIDSSTALGIK